MKKFCKRILNLILLLSALLMALLFVCAWKPEVTERIVQLLYPDGQPAVTAAADGSGAAPGNRLPDSGAAATVSANPDGRESGEEEIRSPGEEETEADEEAGGTQETSVPAVYIAPERSQISVPEEVAGKNGYQEIEGSDNEIEEEEAQELIAGLDTGETGDGLTFDPLFYPYYDMLDENGQRIYRQIYANAEVLNPAFAPVEPITARKLRNVISAVYNDHPELFWLDTAYACKHLGNGQCVEIDLQFNRTARNLEKENAAFQDAAQEIISQAAAFGSDYDKERYVHDTLLHKVSYARSAEMNQSAYSALVNGRTVCAGYARAFQYLMQQLGIPCYYCTGYAGEDHAWNIIKLDDDYYNVDTTWDDTETGEGTYDYFNKTDADYAGTHVRQELSVNLPPCNGETYRSADAGDGDGRRSSAEAGFTDDAVLRSLPDYYNECFDEIMRRGAGSYSFSNVLEGEALFNEWEQAYDTERYKDEYLIEAMRSIGAKSCHLNLNVEKLQQDRYLITHELELH